MDEQPFPRPLQFLDDQNDPLIADFWSLVETNDEINCLWRLTAHQIAAAHMPFARVVAIGSPDPVRQKTMAVLRLRLQVLRMSPMAYLIERLQVHAPDLARVCGKYLQHNLEAILLRLLRRWMGGPPEPPYRWRGEYLTADNPIRVGPHIAGHTYVGIPDEMDPKYLLQLDTYLKAFRPVKRPGRRPKPPSAPRTRQSRHADPRARQAADLKQQGLHWRAIAQKLWPNEPLPTEHKAWERLRKRVERLVVKGRLDTLR